MYVHLFVGMSILVCVTFCLYSLCVHSLSVAVCVVRVAEAWDAFMELLRKNNIRYKDIHLTEPKRIDAMVESWGMSPVQIPLVMTKFAKMRKSAFQHEIHPRFHEHMISSATD